MGNLVDPLYKTPVIPPRTLTEDRQDPLTLQHRVGYSGDESTPTMAVRFNRALRDKRALRPGPGRWVEYILPDLRRVYVESNLRKMYLGRMDDSSIVARVVVKPGGSEYTNDLYSLMMMRMVEVSGDMLDVVRTADKVGLYVSDPETRSQRNTGRTLREEKIKVANLSIVKKDEPVSVLAHINKEASEPTSEDRARREDTYRAGIQAAEGLGNVLARASESKEKMRQREGTRRALITADPKAYYKDQEAKRQRQHKEEMMDLTRRSRKSVPEKGKLVAKGARRGATIGGITGGLLTAGLSTGGNKEVFKKSLAGGATTAALGGLLGARSGAKAHERKTKDKARATEELALRREFGDHGGAHQKAASALDHIKSQVVA